MKSRAWLALAALALGALACDPGTSSPAEGCAKDTDCKGDRVCEGQRCVEPQVASTEDPAKPDAPKPESAGDPTGPAWARGGAGAPTPVAAEGPAKKPELLWELGLGEVIYASVQIRPALSEGEVETAWVGTHGGRFVGVALEGAEAGKLLHEYRLGGRIWGTAAVDKDGRLYVGDDSDHLHAIDPSQDKPLWSRRLGNCESTRAPGPEGARCDVDGGPTIGFDGDLYVGADGLYRVDRATGEVRWHFDGSRPDEDKEKDPKKNPKKDAKKAKDPKPVKAPHIFAAPLVDRRGRVYVGTQRGEFWALDTANGAERWRYEVGPDIDAGAAPGPDGELIFGADDGRIFALRSDGSLRWSFLTQRDIRSALTVAGPDQIYASSFDGKLYRLDAKGSVLWSYTTSRPLASSPVVDAAGRVYFGGQDNRVYALDPEGELLWTVDLPGDVDASVTLRANGQLLVGCDDGTLRAYGSPS